MWSYSPLIFEGKKKLSNAAMLNETPAPTLMPDGFFSPSCFVFLFIYSQKEVF